MTIDMILDEARPTHYQMVCEIRRALAKDSPATFIGYNSLRFDEEFLRQAFYQCLHPPFLTNTSGSTRADALHLVRAAAFLHPYAINVPRNEKGRPSFRLEHLAPANGYSHDNAHDALGDAEATLMICYNVKNRCPELWARFLKFSRKSTVVEFLRSNDAFLVLEVISQRVRPYVVTALGDDLGQSNTAYCYDLTIDPDDLRGLSDEELQARLNRRPSPLRRIKTNAAPTLCPLDEAQNGLLGGVTAAEFARRGRLIREDKAFVDRLLAASAATGTTYPPSPWVERQIYDGFPTHADQRLLDSFHFASWEERVVIADQLEDDRFAWLARRLIFVERPDLLSDDHRTTMAAERSRRMIADDEACGGWTTINRASVSLETMLTDLDDLAAEPFQRLGVYLDGKRAEAERVLTCG